MNEIKIKPFDEIINVTVLTSLPHIFLVTVSVKAFV